MTDERNGAAVRGEPYPARNHDTRVLIISFPVQNSSEYPASSPKNVAMVVWEEPQLEVFEAAKSNSSPVATLTRCRVFEAVGAIGTRSWHKRRRGCRCRWAGASSGGRIRRVRGLLFFEKGRMNVGGE
jgi:hypothetical protein